MAGRAGERNRRAADGATATRSRAAGSRRSPRPARPPADARAAGLRARLGRNRPNAGMGGAFGLSSTRQAALLALVVGALILSVAVPLRTYLSQQDQLKEQTQRADQLRREVSQLQAEKGKMSDPAEIEAEARRRLRFVKPGETPYVVQLPPSPAEPVAPQEDQSKPWYQGLWESISGG